MADKRKKSALPVASKRQRGPTRPRVSPNSVETDSDGSLGGESNESSDSDFSDDDDSGSEHSEVEVGDDLGSDEGAMEIMGTDKVNISNVREMFEDIVTRVPPEISDRCIYRLKVATICSGTDAPIFALNLLIEAIFTCANGELFEIEHMFSCEIEPYKQGFIRRNLPHPTIIFRDVVEMASAAHAVEGKATTAGGTKATIPSGQLDILFCGCSCVDYSNMNSSKPSGRIDILDAWLKDKNDKKDVFRYEVRRNDRFRETLMQALEDLKKSNIGESTRTFFATINLINEKRPKIVILENVYGAPWDMYQHQIFPLIGYYAKFMRLDSKDYYLPQTRQRGYLVAIDCETVDLCAAERITALWETSMKLCARTSTATVTDFLKGPDDPATIQARAEMEQTRGETRTGPKSEWNLSYLRHQTERRAHKLEMNDNPVSMKFMRCGMVVSALYPQHSWRLWFSLQATRVVDLLDIVVASGNSVGVFLTHKTCIVDVSQNVDRSNPIQVSKSGRVALKGSLGIIGCITPSGCPFITDLMRPITGTEVMALQGMPIDEMVLSSETQAQLRDLAGNAMTVTVIGAAAYSIIKSVLEVSPRLFEYENRDSSLISTSPIPRQYQITDPHCPLEGAVKGFRIATGDAATLSEVINQMSRRCHCPAGGLPEGSQKQYAFCDKCGSSACRTCCGNPAHDFSTAEFASLSVISAEEGKLRLKRMLQGSLSMSFSLKEAKLKHISDEQYRNVLRETLSRRKYYLNDIKVTEVVTIIFKSPVSAAHVVLSPSTDVVMIYIYLLPSHGQGSDLPIEAGQPIAQVKGTIYDLLNKEGFSASEWCLWVPDKREGTVDLCKLTDDQVLYSEMKGMLEGVYDHYPSCGTAGNQLHMKGKTGKHPKVFLFRECSRLGPCDLDGCVWSETMRQLEPHEYREVLLHLEPTANPVTLEENPQTQLKVWIGGYWVNSIVKKLDCWTLSRPVPDFHWMKRLVQEAGCPSVSPDNDPGAYGLATVTADIDGFPLPASFKYRLQHCSAGIYQIPAPQRDAFLLEFQFAFVRFGHVKGGTGMLIGTPGKEPWYPIRERCEHCAVMPPAVTILVKQDSTSKKRTRKEAIEDPDEAAAFESQLQQIPRAVTVGAVLEGNQLEIRISLAPMALPSRAFAHLSMAHRTITGGRLDVTTTAKTFVKVVYDYANPSSLSFSPLAAEIRPCSASTAGIIPPSSPGWQRISANPPRFQGDKKRPSYGLRNDQKEAVEWMIRRELSSTDFVEVEFEEEVVRPLNMRVLGKAEWANKFPYCSRGGVCAHDIGYGKTVITLGLIDCQYDNDRNKLLDERKTLVHDVWREELSEFFDSIQTELRYPKLRPGHFFNHLKATLIVVPDHICTQWKDEVAKFLGIAAPKVLVIKAVPQLHEKCSLSALQEADIIIVSTKVFSCASFLDRLAQVSGRPDVSKGISGRHLDIWYKQAMSNVRLLTAYYHAGTAAGIDKDEILRRITRDLIPGIISKTSQELSALEQKIIPPSSRKHYKGKNRAESVAAADKKIASAGRTTKPSEAWTPSWLHNCSFARIVWDECSYENKNVALFVENAVANSKWLLSGTPKLFGLQQICKTAKIFGIHVARPEPRLMPGLPEITKGPEWDIRSKSEDFHRFSSPVKTASLALDRHQQAVKFVSEFYRANTLPPHGFECEELVLPVSMVPLTSARYQLACQEVEDTDSDFGALPAHARNEIRPNIQQYARDKEDPGYLTRMLLGQLACGLGRKLQERFTRHAATPPPDDLNRDSVYTLRNFSESLESEKRVHGHYLKFYWDKAMWLARWIKGVPWTPHNKLSPLTGLIVRMGEEMQTAARTGEYDLFGDEGCLMNEAAFILGELVDNAGNVLQEDWVESFHQHHFLFTWIDFFQVDEALVDQLSQEQMKYLVEDLCYFRRKWVCATSQHPSRDPMEARVIRDILAEDLKRRRSRVAVTSKASLIPAVERDLAWIESKWSAHDLRVYIKWWLKLKPSKPNWEDDKKTFTGGIRDYARLNSQDKKQAILLLLNQANLKCPISTNLDQLMLLLWEHQNGVAEPKAYRDGRGPPDRYHDFKEATAPASSLKDQQDATVDAMKATMSPLSKSTEDFRIIMREHRYVNLFEQLVPKDSQVKNELICEKCETVFTVPGEEAYLVVACGHLLCRQCRYHSTSGCPISNCPASTRGRPVLRSSYIQRSLASAVNFDKIDFVIDQIKHILEHYPQDKILVFAQYKGVIDALWTAIERLDPRALNLTQRGRDASKQVTEFQKSTNAKTSPKIFLMDIDTESSAGTNLQCANHIIFANPYNHADKDHQARTVLQARGRCLRQGQTKKVFIYHFMTPNTIEEMTLRELADSGMHKELKRYFEKHHESLPWWLESGGKVDRWPVDRSEAVYVIRAGDPVWRGELFERKFKGRKLVFKKDGEGVWSVFWRERED
ncbi:DNA repair protein RAD5 [Podospora fimiseda]|uniref:DNA repair protein RAD5 n=1 Tax=Podospora fimiseda TaxID=252190 RepID=A0AAN7H532_9PEZI|nr:DNA repair protein RAD5 [Podospora fimiseda]